MHRVCVCMQVLDVALVSLMAPAAVLGGASKAAMATTWLARTLAKIPSAFFEASVPVSHTHAHSLKHTHARARAHARA